MAISFGAFCFTLFLINVEQFKKTLGPHAELLTDEQIKRLRDAYYDLANTLFDSWLKGKPAHKTHNDKIEP